MLQNAAACCGMLRHAAAVGAWAQGSPGVIAGHPEIAIFQLTHAGLKTVVGPHKGADLGNLEMGPGTPKSIGVHGSWLSFI